MRYAIKIHFNSCDRINMENVMNIVCGWNKAFDIDEMSPCRLVIITHEDNNDIKHIFDILDDRTHTTIIVGIYADVEFDDGSVKRFNFDGLHRVADEFIEFCNNDETDTE